MKLQFKKKKSIYRNYRFVYKIHKVIKCSGLAGYWNVSAKIDYTGSSYYATIIYFNCHKGGKQFYSNSKFVYEVNKHNKNFWSARRFVKSFLENMPDYFKGEKIIL